MSRDNLLTQLYYRMFVTRTVELAIQSLYSEDEMKTPMHMSMGSEAISAGLCRALGTRGAVLGTYRSHALYLSKTDDIEGFMDEMYGKATGVGKGKAGSMHLCNPDKGFIGSSAIVGGIIPIAVGYAFACQFLAQNTITAVLFGDGATNEGAFWESINLACLKKLPVIFVCEDNDLAVHTSKADRNGYSWHTLHDIVSNFDCYVYDYEGTEVEAIYDTFISCIKDMDNDPHPCFVHLNYYRYLQHVGVDSDFDKGYRDEEDFKIKRKYDPVDICRAQLFQELLREGLSQKRVIDMEERVKDRVVKAIDRAKKASVYSTILMAEGVYYE